MNQTILTTVTTNYHLFFHRIINPPESITSIITKILNLLTNVENNTFKGE